MKPLARKQGLVVKDLPDEVLKRPKQGFASALPYMLRDEYRLLFNLFLSDSHLARDELVRPPEVKRLLGEHEAGSADHGNRLWLLLSTEVWYRMYLEGSSVEDLESQIQAQVS